MDIWAGGNQDIFWGRCDDDLISQMLSSVVEFSESEIQKIEQSKKDSETREKKRPCLAGITDWLSSKLLDFRKN